MKKNFIGKIMVMSLVLAGLIQVSQKLFFGNVAILMNMKLFFLVLALIIALIMYSVMSWRVRQEKKSID